MAPTPDASSTQVAVIGTEHILFDTTQPGTYTFDVDRAAMLGPDALTLRVYKMVLSGGARHVYIEQPYSGVPATGDVIATSVPVSTGLSDSGALRFTLQQTAGTGRSFPWSVLRYT